MTERNATNSKIPARRKGRERRQAILDAAKATLIEKGIEGLVLREIAEDMGITHGNLQYYFKTKNELLKSLFDEEVNKYTSGLKEAVSLTTSREGRIAAILDSAFQVLEEQETKLWRILWGVADQSDDLAKILQRENDFYEETLAQELVHIVPGASPQRRAHYAGFIRMLMDGMAVLLIYEPTTSPRYRALKNELVAFLSSLLVEDQ
jgi:AcrR family transcriptional regulator